MNTSRSHDHHSKNAFRGYRVTVIYTCLAVTLNLALLVYDLIHGPIPTPCP